MLVLAGARKGVCPLRAHLVVVISYLFVYQCRAEGEPHSGFRAKLVASSQSSREDEVMDSLSMAARRTVGEGSPKARREDVYALAP